MARVTCVPQALLLMSLHLWCIQAAKLLFVPFPLKSVLGQFESIATVLRDKGHTISLLLPPSYPEVDSLRAGKVYDEVLVYTMEKPDIYSMSTPAEGMSPLDLYDVPLGKSFRAGITEESGFLSFCTNPLGDESLHDTLKEKQFDLAVVYASPESRCLMILWQKLGLRYVGFQGFYEPWLSGNPGLPSAVPLVFGQAYTERMSFLERFWNLLCFLEWTVFPDPPPFSQDFVWGYLPGESRSMHQMALQAELWLVDTDVVIDYPKPVMPNEIHVGGLTARDPNLLAKDLHELMEKASQGVVIVSFGSQVVLAESHQAMMLSAFGELPYTVLWRIPTYQQPSRVPNNVVLMDWLPQNDLLGHRHVKLFVTHCGSGGQFEALYHGVPMLGVPVFLDQHHNARRMAYHGFGEFIDIRSMTSKQLVAAINGIVNNATYAETIRKASEIYRSRPMSARQRAAYWVEHVLKHGAGYLRSHAVDMPWYEYLMVDILCPMVLGCVVLLWLIWRLAGCLLRSFTRSRKQKQT